MKPLLYVLSFITACFFCYGVSADNIHDKLMKIYDENKGVRLKLDLRTCTPSHGTTDIINESQPDKDYKWVSFTHHSDSGRVVKASQEDGSQDTVAYFYDDTFSAPKDYKTMAIYEVRQRGTLVVAEKEIWFTVIRTQNMLDGDTPTTKTAFYTCPHESLSVDQP